MGEGMSLEEEIEKASPEMALKRKGEEFKAMLISDSELKSAINILEKFYNAQKSGKQNWYTTLNVGIKDYEMQYVERLHNAGILSKISVGIFSAYCVTDKGKSLYEELSFMKCIIESQET
jgi:predicted transcriptional regulator